MNILSIKLHRPALPAKSISRPALIQQLNDGLEAGRPMTLISAPAGFGKTTCAAEWLLSLKAPPAQPPPVAWLSLDADDNDPGRFFTYLSAALKKAGDGMGCEAFSRMREVESVFASGQLPPLEVIADALIADAVEAPARFLLFLDDFHLIQERFILKVFEKLLASLFQANRPQPMHLVLLTREDPSLPLARLRASGLLTEIRADELRFSSDEAGRFLNELMGLGLAETDVRVLEERTEGWAAGLQLAGLSIRGRADPTGFIQGLSGSHRFILSYLTEEVLSRQPEPVQQFLLETSILDRLCGDLCSAVTGRSDSPLLLEQLCSANLFLVPLGDDAAGPTGANWYRYHHLFADLLRSRQSVLQGEKTPELHRRASRWYAQAAAQSVAPAAMDERAALVREAVRHALAAEDYAGAVHLIETHVTEILNQWYARTVTDWMQALPPEWSAQSPRANLAFARMHLFRGDFVQAFPYLERLQGIFSAGQGGENQPGENRPGGFHPPVSPGLRAEWLALQSSMSGAMGRPAEALDLARQALALVPEKDASTSGQIYLALATAYQQLDDIPRAVESFQKVIQLGRESANLITELLGLSALSLMVIERGQLHNGFELAAQGAERMERSGALLPICAGIYGELGQVCYHWFQLDQAEQYLKRAAQVSSLGSFSDAGIYFSVFRSRLGLLRGDVNAAAREIRQAADQMRADAPVVVREEVVAQQVTVLLAQGDLPGAEQVLYREMAGLQRGSTFPHLDPGQTIPYTQGVLYLGALRILLHRLRHKSQPAAQSVFAAGEQTLPGAIEMAGRLLASLLQRQYIPLAIVTLLLRAQLYSLLGDARASLADVSSALDMAQPEGYISEFVAEGQSIAYALVLLLERGQQNNARAEFITRILDSFQTQQSAGPAAPPAAPEQASPTALVEPLTERELEVLRLVAEGKAYQEIAARLVVSINTVRTHIKSIYGKLGASSRMEAVEAARQAKIL